MRGVIIWIALVLALRALDYLFLACPRINNTNNAAVVVGVRTQERIATKSGLASNADMPQERFLADCPSPPHRAVAGLLRLALTGHLADGAEEDCSASDAMAVAEIAQGHFVDTALAPAFVEGSPIRDYFPDDLALFFTEMATANGRRNEKLKAQLGSIGAAFSDKGIEAVALKGACELIDPWWAEPAGRYLSDLDLLVSE